MSGQPFTIRNIEQPPSQCTAPVDRAAPVRAFLRARKGTATLVVRNGAAQREVTLDATPRWVGLGPLQDAGGEFVLQAGTGAAEIGGLRDLPIT